MSSILLIEFTTSEIVRKASSEHPYEVLTYAGKHGYQNLALEAGTKAADITPIDALIYAANGGHDDLVKVAQPKAIDRDPVRVMNLADNLGVDGLGKASAQVAIQRGFAFLVLEYAMIHNLQDTTEAAAQGTLSTPLRITQAAKCLSHRNLVAWVCI